MIYWQLAEEYAKFSERVYAPNMQESILLWRDQLNSPRIASIYREKASLQNRKFLQLRRLALIFREKWCLFVTYFRIDTDITDVSTSKPFNPTHISILYDAII